eukprot:scaffold24294_cov113-Phaeocystis_antarctica.AAC.1
MSYWSPSALRRHPIFGRRVAGVHLYDSIAFIDRGAEQAPLAHAKLGKRRASFTDGSLPNRLRKEPAYADEAGELKKSLRQQAAHLPLRHTAQPAWLRQATEATWPPAAQSSPGGCSLEAPSGLEKEDTPAAGAPEAAAAIAEPELPQRAVDRGHCLMRCDRHARWWWHRFAGGRARLPVEVPVACCVGTNLCDRRARAFERFWTLSFPDRLMNCL